MVDGWRLIVAHTVLFAARLSLSSAESNITDIIQLLGPRTAVDVVGLLDRSQGVSRHNFYYYIQPFFHDLLSQYATIHRDFARSAVVTFARDVTVAYDTVSGSDAAAAGVSKCELFEASPSLYDRVEFVTDPSIIRGTNITGAMQRAIDILEHGRANRPNVIQVIVLVSDGDHDNDEDPFNERLILKSRGVTIFSVGVGSWLREGVMRHLATIPGYYDQFENWKNLLHAQPTNIPPGTAPLLVELDASFCGNNTCAEAGTRCYCDVDTADHRCLCAPGYHLPSTDASAVCQPCPKNSFKDTPGSGPCLECPPDRVTSHNGSTSRRDCHCDNTSCAADPCVNSSCPFGEHCVALNGLNTTCASNCPYSNCTRDFDVDTNPDVDPCADWNPCQNEGTCYKDPRGKRACKCRFNFEGKFCTPIDMCAKFRPCNEEGTVRCVAEIGSFKCICLYGRHGEFCQDINPDPPFTGSTVNETLNATSSPIVDSTSNSTNASLA